MKEITWLDEFNIEKDGVLFNSKGQFMSSKLKEMLIELERIRAEEDLWKLPLMKRPIKDSIHVKYSYE